MENDMSHIVKKLMECIKHPDNFELMEEVWKEIDDHLNSLGSDYEKIAFVEAIKNDITQSCKINNIRFRAGNSFAYEFYSNTSQLNPAEKIFSILNDKIDFFERTHGNNQLKQMEDDHQKFINDLEERRNKKIKLVENDLQKAKDDLKQAECNLQKEKIEVQQAENKFIEILNH